MKTKVIAFRVNEREHELLEFRAKSCGMKISELIRLALDTDLATARAELEKAEKRAEAKAKREAKKAVTDELA